jgi:hypothetical protein
MFDHIMLRVRGLKASGGFYRRAPEPLGYVTEDPKGSTPGFGLQLTSRNQTSACLLALCVAWSVTSIAALLPKREPIDRVPETVTAHAQWIPNKIPKVRPTDWLCPCAKATPYAGSRNHPHFCRGQNMNSTVEDHV